MINISCKNFSQKEQGIRQLLEKIIQFYPEEYIFTHDIIIEDAVIPHSHPVLTLNTRDEYLNNPDILLSTFIHEQIHWFLSGQDINMYLEKLKSIYPNIAVGSPEGARDECSSYLHIIVNYLEIYILKTIIGKEKASIVLDFLKADHYTEIYKIVENDYESLTSLLSPLLRAI